MGDASHMKVYRIIIVDDNEDNLISIKAILSNYDPAFAIETATSGKQGIELAKSIQPDIIILDVLMPVMDGFQTTELLRKDILTRHIPILLLTALSNDSETRIKGLQLGADAFLSKPFNPEELVAHIKVLLRIKTAEDSLREYADNLETAIQKTTHELEGSQTRLKSLMSNLPGIVFRCLIDEHWTMKYVSDGCFSLTGYRPEDFIDNKRKSFNDIIIPQDRERVYRTIFRMLRKSQQYTVEYRIQHADGQNRWVWEQGSKTIMPDHTECIDGFITDITEKKQLEFQLLQSQKLETIGTLAGGIAHDFNNLLTVIQGQAELLSFTLPDSPEVQEGISRILSATSRAAELTGKLLVFSRIEVHNLHPLQLNEVITTISPMLNRLIGEHTAIKTTLAEKLPLIEADKGNLEQILMNLVINARDAMPQGGEIHISTRLLSVSEIEKGVAFGPEAAEHFVQLSIQDTGIGMSAELLQRVFEPFFTTKPEGKGTGLGLSVVYGIVKNHHGFLDVHSKELEGTDFRIYFPVQEQYTEDSDSKQQADVHALDSEQNVLSNSGIIQQKNQSSQQSNIEILLIEDEKIVRELTKTALEHAGYTVHAAPDGASARDLAARNPSIKLIISDMILPDTTGLLLVDELHPLLGDIPVIFCSGYMNKDTQNELLLRTQYAFLAKPFRIADLLNTTQMAIQEDRDGSESI